MSRTIFVALNKVAEDLAEVGIAKGQTNTFDNYQFRGIDDVLNAMAPILAEHGVLIIPSVVEDVTHQVPTKNGGVQNHSKVRIDYTLYDREGDSITHRAVGEALDRGDKSINKAMTAAFKYFLFQAFCIPLQGSDADSESHEVEAAKVGTDEKNEILGLCMRTETEPEGFITWLGYGSLESVPLSEHPRAIHALNQKLLKIQQGESK